MRDYDLSGLSARSFEQLVQSLATKVLGIKVQVFGDGPDGGREATFDGRVPYSTGAASWDGYGVIQAKFRQRAQGSPKDAEWALRHLRDELRKYRTARDGRRQPDYYIFATNVVLTPVLKRGSKDRAIEALEAFKRESSLSDYDIWDYDKLRTLLDQSEDIRRAYAAWITPGDVLATVIDSINHSRPDFDSILTTFLQKELLSDQFANLEQAGRAADERIPTARVFVDLPAYDQPVPEQYEFLENGKEPPGCVAQLLETASLRLDHDLPLPPRAHAEQDSTPLRHPGRFVLIGGPGQGKTTLGQYACQLFRAAILKDKPGNLLSAETKAAIDLIYGGEEQQLLTISTARRFPLRVVLSKFGTLLASPDEADVDSVLSYLVHHIKHRVDSEITADDLRSWLKIYPWFIVFDGLDEVPASSNRNAVLDAIRDFWVDLAGSDVLVLATTRPQGYNADFSPQLYNHRWLADLTTQRAMTYAKRLTMVRYVGDKDRQEKVLTRLQRASTVDTTARLMRSPLQVTIMATLVDRMGQPPQERWNLFSKYYDVIYQRETERDIPAASILADYKTEIDSIHRRVALLLQIEAETSGSTDARLSADRFGRIVDARLAEEGHDEVRRISLRSSIIEAATDRLVFLVGLEANRVGFEIRSLQEYMAAEGLMDGSDDEIRKRLAEIAPISSWRNVFLFAAGKCFSDRQHLRDAIHTICSLLNEDIDDEAMRITLAGSRLALDLLEDGSVLRQPRYLQLLAREALRLLDLSPDLLQVRLAAVYTADAERVYKEEILRRLGSADTRRRLGALTCLVVLSASKVSWASRLITAHWPTDADEEATIAITAGPRGLSGALKRRIYPHLGRWTVEDVQTLYLALGYRAARNRRGPRGKEFLHGLEKALGMYQPSRPHVVLWHMDNGKLALAFESITSEENRALVEMAEASEEVDQLSPDWLPFVAGGRLASNPSATTLARELRLLAAAGQSRGTMSQLGVGRRTWLVSSLPWPLGACIGAASAAEDLESLAGLAEQGALGDFSDWKEAETRWQAIGLATEDIEYVARIDLPFDSSISTVGFPLLGSKYFEVGLSEGRLSALVAAYQQMRQGKTRNKMADIVLDAYDTYTYNRFEKDTDAWARLCKGERPESWVEPWPVDDLLGLYRDSTGVRSEFQDFDVLYRSWCNRKFDKESLELLDAIGTKVERAIGSDPLENWSKALLATYLANKKYQGVLRLLALLHFRGHTTEPLSYKDDIRKLRSVSLMGSAVIMKLRSGTLEDADVKALEGRINELVRTDSEIARRIIDAGRYAYGAAPMRLLMTMYAECMTSVDLRLASSALQVVTEYLDRRKSRLREPTVWTQLHIPIDLSV
jgi:hypothetical protein